MNKEQELPPRIDQEIIRTPENIQRINQKLIQKYIRNLSEGMHPTIALEIWLNDLTTELIPFLKGVYRVRLERL